MNGECPECLVHVLDCRCMPRPEIPIDWERVDELLIAGCLGTEIASYFSMHPNTFYDRVVAKYNVSFTEYSTQKKATGEALLREAQFKKAIKKHDNTMLVWLGKQRLGQKETPSDHVVSEEIMKHYIEVMSQIATLQSDRKIADSNKSNELKSA
jgi:predicted metal-binding transcription factor (methanogenesis marker protein 9)